MSNKETKRFDSSKFKPANDHQLVRRQNTKEERIKDDPPKILFSFRDFDIKQIPPGQNYTHWQKDQLLAYMLEKFGHICAMTITEAQQKSCLKIYDSFPQKTNFKKPQHINDDVHWAVITNIGGQKSRVAGHIIGNVFYVVFLDKDHKFYIADKKNT
ncbi:MAG: hypothetical protein QM535_21435 [Limnohabitans sp.]|nr:hypothetical protein [Limnohabitans sp.]